MLEAWYVRNEWDMISLPKISKDDIKTNAATYYIIPRPAISSYMSA